jgi:two-component system, NtrC family, response regulator AtoC
MRPSTILIVDDEQAVRLPLRMALEHAGYQVLEASDGRQALQRCESNAVDLILLDYRLPDTDGIALLRQLKEADAEVVVIMMTAHSSVDLVVEAMKQGAFHYTTKPFEIDELLVLVEKGLETTRLRREVKALVANQSEPYTFDRIIGDSPGMLEVKDLLRKIAGSPASTVLLLGESGTGKDLAAKAVHFNSARKTRAFMNITCSALPEALLESELFGYERGAFTDARQQKKGLLELADQGTVFLDEFTEMSPALQAKLLRFLEEKAFKRVGGTVDLRVDVRVVAATNRSMDEAVKDGVLRKDLYYRLQVLPVKLPPLRERKGDVPLLAKFFIDVFNREFKKKVRGITLEARDLLMTAPWEGNVRELRNAFERAMLFAEAEELSPKDFPTIATSKTVNVGYRLPSSGINFDELERSLVSQALERAKGNRTHAAALLGMTRDRMRYRIEKFGLE